MVGSYHPSTQEPDRSIARRIFDREGELAQDPHRFVQELVNSPFHRLREGDYRVILDIQGEALRILILTVGHRESIYDR